MAQTRKILTKWSRRIILCLLLVHGTFFVSKATALGASIPADPAAISKVKEVFAFLQQAPAASSNRVLSGQMIGWINGVAPSRLDTIAQRSGGLYPAIVQADYYNPNLSHVFDPNDFTRVNPTLIDQANKGAIISIQVQANNPQTQVHGSVFSFMDEFTFSQIAVEGSLLNSRWKQELDRWAIGLAELQSNNVVVLLRPFHELNYGAWWWGAKLPENFKAVWRMTFNYLTQVKGIHNCLWVYNLNAVPNSTAYLDYYPGDAYVDIVSLDKYWGLGVGPFDGYDQLVTLGKPFAIAEFGPFDPTSWSNPSPSLSFNFAALIQHIRQSMPQTVYWISWESVFGMDWQSNFGIDVILNDSWVANRGEIVPNTTLDALAPAQPRNLMVQ